MTGRDEQVSESRTIHYRAGHTERRCAILLTGERKTKVLEGERHGEGRPTPVFWIRVFANHRHQPAPSSPFLPSSLL